MLYCVVVLDIEV